MVKARFVGHASLALMAVAGLAGCLSNPEKKESAPAPAAQAPAAAPALVLSGGADPVTPPRHGERVAHALGAKARHVVVPNAGHGVMALGCMRDLLFRFVDADDGERALAQLDTACVQGIPRPPAFVTPRDEDRP